MNLENYNPKTKPKKLEKIDELFLKKLNNLIKVCTDNFEQYEYSKAKSETERFFWNIFADNYLEIVKKRVYKGTGNKKLSAQYTLYHSLLTILKLLAPIMPFITEEIYQTYFRKTEKEKSIHLTEWPKTGKTEDANQLDLFINLLSKIRQKKSSNKKPMNSEISLTLDKKDFKELKELLQDIQDVAVAKEIKEGKFEVEFV